MPLSHEHVGSKILAKIKIHVLTRGVLLLPLCYEIPCNKYFLQYEIEVFFLGSEILAQPLHSAFLGHRRSAVTYSRSNSRYVLSKQQHVHNGIQF